MVSLADRSIVNGPLLLASQYGSEFRCDVPWRSAW
jgi:hypothetical protein